MSQEFVLIAHETPLQRQTRLRAERDAAEREAQERLARQERARQERAAHPHLEPRKMLSECRTPAEIDEWRAEQKRYEDEQIASKAQRQDKERARIAYFQAGGDEAGFEKDYPALRDEAIRAETLRRLSQPEQLPSFTFNTPDDVKW